MDEEQDELPVLTAVSSSARQLYTLLRCINFSDKAHVQINEDGLKFSVDEASSMEGSAFLDKSLFTTYTYHAPPPPERPQHPDSDEEDEDLNPIPTFQISLPSLLETLQILGLTDPNTSRNPWARDNPSFTAFSNNVLGVNAMCRISYHGLGSPLSLILTEASIRTTCNLTTYEPEYTDEIPFDRGSLAFKTIMRGTWLSDAIQELASTTPESVSLVARIARNGKPFFALSASGPLGSARVEFNNDPSTSSSRPPPTVDPLADNASAQQPHVLETFQLSDPTVPLRATYKFSLIQKAAKVMSIASKVSIRADTQGVLSLQFMIQLEDGKRSFVDFRFVPLVEDEDADDGGEDTFVGHGNDSGSETQADEEMLVG